MTWSLNRVELVGNVGKDPDIRTTQDGLKIVNLSLATSESWTYRASGERKERTEWHRVVIFSEGLAKVAEQYLKKGSRVYLEGQLQTRKWQDQGGQDRYSTEVVLQNFSSQMVLLDRAGGGGGGGYPDDNGSDFGSSSGSSGGGRSAPARQPAMAGAGRRDDMDDEIPF